MRVDDAVDDGEAEAGALLARREERIEDALARVGGNAWAGVLDRQDHESAARTIGGAQPRLAGAKGDLADGTSAHGLDRVAHEVRHRLRHQRAVGAQLAAAVDVQADLHRLLLEQPLAVGQRHGEDLAGARGLGVHARIAREAQHIAHDAIESVGGAADLVDARRRFGAVGHIVLEELGVQRDGTQRVADLVGDARSHLAKRGQRARAAQALVGLRELGLQPLDLRAQRHMRLLQARHGLGEGAHELPEVGALRRRRLRKRGLGGSTVVERAHSALPVGETGFGRWRTAGVGAVCGTAAVSAQDLCARGTATGDEFVGKARVRGVDLRQERHRLGRARSDVAEVARAPRRHVACEPAPLGIDAAHRGDAALARSQMIGEQRLCVA